jgi:hypothetical protein
MPDRVAGNGFDLNSSRKIWVTVFRDQNRKLVKRARFSAIGFGKLNFDSVIADGDNMADSDRFGSQYGDWLKVARTSPELSALSF